MKPLWGWEELYQANILEGCLAHNGSYPLFLIAWLLFLLIQLMLVYCCCYLWYVAATDVSAPGSSLLRALVLGCLLLLYMPLFTLWLTHFLLSSRTSNWSRVLNVLWNCIVWLTGFSLFPKSWRQPLDKDTSTNLFRSEAAGLWPFLFLLRSLSDRLSSYKLCVKVFH